MCSSYQISGNMNVNLFFAGVQRLKKEPVMKSLLPGENDIVVENKLEVWVYMFLEGGKGRDAHLGTVWKSEVRQPALWVKHS